MSDPITFITPFKMVTLLCDNTLDDCFTVILPPWMDGDEDASLRKAHSDIQTLKRQRADLCEIFPAKKAQFDAEFNKLVLEIVRELHARLFSLENL